MLNLLALNAGQVVSKSELSQHALGRTLSRYDRSVDVHVSSIRQKLDGDREDLSCIRTIRGKGYQFYQGRIMNGLFWKFFTAFCLALLLAGGTVGFYMWLQFDRPGHFPPRFSRSNSALTRHPHQLSQSP